MNRNWKKKYWVILCALTGCMILGAVSAYAGEFEVFNMKGFEDQPLKFQPFKVTDDGYFDIEVIGARYIHSDQMYAFGWILDSETRELIWSMAEENTRRYEGERNLRIISDEIRLDRGDYEAYYFAGAPFASFKKFGMKKDVDDLGDLIDMVTNMLGDEVGEEFEKYSEFQNLFMFKLSSGRSNFVLKNIDQPEYPNEVFSIVQPLNMSSKKQGFKLTEATNLVIYAFGEYSDNDEVFVDGAKIIDADNRQKVWSMERWNTDWAGGAPKNRCFHDNIMLDKGEYVLEYWTDDSHTFDDWNDVPPYDPYFYGIVVSAESPEDIANVQLIEVESYRYPLLQIVRVTDNQDIGREFTLKQAADLNVYAIGEGKKGYMYDFGWIEEAETHEHSWEMKEEETEHAGGAYKNRLIDQIIELPKGKYILRYKTDGSHSYRDWNEPQPTDASHYGITLYGYGKDFDKSVVEVGEQIIYHTEPPKEYRFVLGKNKEVIEAQIEMLEKHAQEMEEGSKEFEMELQLKLDALEEALVALDELEEMEKIPVPEPVEVKPPKHGVKFGDGDVLASLVEIGNSQKSSAVFSLDKPARIRIFAIGEGKDDMMYDYGWIENTKTGDIIWEMTFRKTNPAGGAEKNRIVDDVILLDKGSYKVVYVSDDSHSFNSWNETPPVNPQYWGITILKEQEM